MVQERDVRVGTLQRLKERAPVLDPADLRIEAAKGELPHRKHIVGLAIFQYEDVRTASGHRAPPSGSRCVLFSSSQYDPMSTTVLENASQSIGLVT